MFRVIVSHEYSSNRPNENMDLAIKTERLFELLGRYQVKYGSPEIVVKKDGVITLEYYKDMGNNEFETVSVAYAKYANDNKNDKPKTKAGSSIERKHINRTYDNSGYSGWHGNRSYSTYNSTVDESISDERFDNIVASGVMTKRTY